MIHWPGLWPGAATLHRELGPECSEWLVPSQPRHSARTVRCKFMLISRVWCSVVCSAGNVSIAEKTDLEPGVTRRDQALPRGTEFVRECPSIIWIQSNYHNILLNNPNNTKLCLSDWFKVFRVDSRQNPCCKNPDKKWQFQDLSVIKQAQQKTLWQMRKY